MTTNAEYRKAFLEEVIKTVCADRNITHGDAEDNFRTIAALWTNYLQARYRDQIAGNINSTDVAAMMCLFKVARLAANPTNRDNWLDLAGYAACGAGVTREKKPAPDRYDAQPQPGDFETTAQKPLPEKIVYLCEGPAGKQLIVARYSNEAAIIYSDVNNCPVSSVTVLSAP